MEPPRGCEEQVIGFVVADSTLVAANNRTGPATNAAFNLLLVAVWHNCHAREDFRSANPF
jgi:hypothetical protein